MKRVLLLFLAAWISGCKQAPEPPASDTPVIKATPVQNAPQTSPMPIQPLNSAPAVPQTKPLPPLINARAASGTTAATATVSPVPQPTGTSPITTAPSPSITGS